MLTNEQIQEARKLCNEQIPLLWKINGRRLLPAALDEIERLREKFRQLYGALKEEDFFIDICPPDVDCQSGPLSEVCRKCWRDFCEVGEDMEHHLGGEEE